MPPIEPRPYQDAAVIMLRQAWLSGRRALLLVIPTGGGKTLVLSLVIRSSFDKAKRVLFLVHRKELIDQAVGALQRLDMNPGIIAPWAPSSEAQVRVGSIDTLKARDERPDADLVVYDEFHHAVAPGNFELVDYYKQRGITIIGMTATPERDDGVAMGNVCDALVAPVTYSQLIAGGWLVPALVYGPPAKRYTLSDEPIDAFRMRCPDGQGILFAPSIAGGKALTARANVMGIRAGWVDGSTPTEERERTVEAFKRGNLRLLVNYACFTEGFDAPDCQWLGIARNVQSTLAYLQITGRILRAAKGKRFGIVSDLMGVTHLHGLPHADRVYSLTGRAIQLAKDPKELDLVQCPGCLMYFLGKEFETSVCPCCGHQRKGRMDPKLKREIQQNILHAHPDTKRIETLRTLVGVASRKGYKMFWVIKQFEIRYGHRPSREMLSSAGYWVAQQKAKAGQ